MMQALSLRTRSWPRTLVHVELACEPRTSARSCGPLASRLVHAWRGMHLRYLAFKPGISSKVLAAAELEGCLGGARGAGELDGHVLLAPSCTKQGREFGCGAVARGRSIYKHRLRACAST